MRTHEASKFQRHSIWFCLASSRFFLNFSCRILGGVHRASSEGKQKKTCQPNKSTGQASAVRCRHTRILSKQFQVPSKVPYAYTLSLVYPFWKISSPQLFVPPFPIITQLEMRWLQPPYDSHVAPRNLVQTSLSLPSTPTSPPPSPLNSLTAVHRAHRFEVFVSCPRLRLTSHSK